MRQRTERTEPFLYRSVYQIITSGPGSRLTYSPGGAESSRGDQYRPVLVIKSRTLRGGVTTVTIEHVARISVRVHTYRDAAEAVSVAGEEIRSFEIALDTDCDDKYSTVDAFSRSRDQSTVFPRWRFDLSCTLAGYWRLLSSWVLLHSTVIIVRASLSWRMIEGDLLVIFLRIFSWGFIWVSWGVRLLFESYCLSVDGNMVELGELWIMWNVI